MIERTNAFRVGESSFLILKDAQRHELEQLIHKDNVNGKPPLVFDIKDFARWILENKTSIIDIITTTSSSKTKARKINGGHKTRNKKVLITDSPISTADHNSRLLG